MTKISNKIDNASNQIAVTIENLEKIIDFLKENQEYWNVNEGKLQFNNAKVLAEYYDLRSNLVGE